MSNAKYLKVTLHDNDFTSIIEFSSMLLYELIVFFDEYASYDISDKNLSQLKDDLHHLLYTTYKIYNYLHHRECNTKFDYFKPDLEIVDYLDIPEWDNNESVFIPLFDGDIITR